MQKLNRFFYVLCEIACVALAVMMAFFIATNNSPLFLEIGADNAIFLTVGKAIAAISKADLLIVGGTSLTVYPAAGFLGYYEGHRLVLINRDVTPMDDQADLVIHDSVGKVFSTLHCS